MKEKIQKESKAEYTEFLQTEDRQRVLQKAGFGQGEEILKNNLLNLMAEVLRPDKQDDVYAHPNLLLRDIDLIQSTPEALRNACKEARLSARDSLSDGEMKRLKGLRA